MSDRTDGLQRTRRAGHGVPGRLARPGQRARFDLHLLECDGCENYLQQFRSTVETVGNIRYDELDPAFRKRLLEAFKDCADHRLPDHMLGTSSLTPTLGEIVTTQDITAEKFNDTINDNEIVLVDFWASWCGPCRAFAPTFAASSEKHPDVVHAKVDTEAEQELAAAAEIRAIPTLMAFKKGKLVFNQAGRAAAGGPGGPACSRSRSSTSTPRSPRRTTAEQD